MKKTKFVLPFLALCLFASAAVAQPIIPNTPWSRGFLQSQYPHNAHMQMDPRRFGLTPLEFSGPTRLVIIGDSNSGSNTIVSVNWPYWVTNSPSTTLTFTTNQAVSGLCQWHHLTNFEAAIMPLKPSGGTNTVLIDLSGENDINNGSNIVGVLITKSNLYQACFTNGIQVCAVTMPAFTEIVDFFESERTALNNWIKYTNGNLKRWVVDAEAILDMTKYSQGGLHLKPEGHRILAQAIKDTLNPPADWLLEPERTVIFLDEFFQGANVQGWVQNAGLGGGNGWGTSERFHPGISRVMSLVNSTNGASSMYRQNIGGFYLTNTVTKFDCCVEVSHANGGTNFWVGRLGLMTVNTVPVLNATQNPVNGLFFEYNTNNVNWVFKSISASTTTSNSTSIPVTAGWHTLSFTADLDATNVIYAVDGVIAGTNTINIPLTEISPFGSVYKCFGLDNRYLSFDYLQVQQLMKGHQPRHVKP
jgi:hypothetical protein